MSDIEITREKYVEAKKAVDGCRHSIVDLQRKCDSLEESLPGLYRLVESAEKVKQQALDDFALSSNKESESRLKQARLSHEKAQKDVIEANELVEATFRAVKRQESGLIRLDEACSQGKRAVWEAISGEFESQISNEIKETVATIVSIGCQLGRPYQFVLSSLFPNPDSATIQQIQKQICEEYKID